MGQEARCQVNYAGETAECTALLETHELILRATTLRATARNAAGRGGKSLFPRRIPIASISGIQVQGDQLTFLTGAGEVALALGHELAQRWAAKLTTPPPTLARKLGLAPNAKILLIGEPESEALQAALVESAANTGNAATRNPDQIIACLNTETDLDRALAKITAHPSIPAWVIYPKGAKSTLPESTVRNTLRGQGFIDTKVASVDARYTALRFIKRS